MNSLGQCEGGEEGQEEGWGRRKRKKKKKKKRRKKRKRKGEVRVAGEAERQQLTMRSLVS